MSDKHQKEYLDQLLYDLNIVKDNVKQTKDVLERGGDKWSNERGLSNEARLKLESEIKDANKLIEEVETYLRENNLV